MKVIRCLIVCSALVCFGCSYERDAFSIDCDSGFSTGLSSVVSMGSGGVVKWQKEINGKWKSRKMLLGEICTSTRHKNNT